MSTDVTDEDVIQGLKQAEDMLAWLAIKHGAVTAAKAIEVLGLAFLFLYAKGGAATRARILLCLEHLRARLSVVQLDTEEEAQP